MKLSVSAILCLSNFLLSYIKRISKDSLRPTRCSFNRRTDVLGGPTLLTPNSRAVGSSDQKPTVCWPLWRGNTRKNYICLSRPVQLQKSKIYFSGPTLTASNSALPVLKWPCKDIGGILFVSKCTCKIARSYFSSRAIERQIIKLFIEFFRLLVGYHEWLESTDWSIESTSTKASHPLLPVWGQSRFSTQNCECNQKAKQQAKHNTKG